MIYFPTTSLFVEGPDCSGKTTLIKNIHRLSKYRWHIQDRSHLSRKIFNDLYCRNNDNDNFNFHLEASNLNNRFIFLLPALDEIVRRFNERGDDIHKDVESIEKVYDAFKSEVSNISGYPNFIFCFSSDIDSKIESIVSSIKKFETFGIVEISECVKDFVRFNRNESYPLSFTIYEDGKFDDSGLKLMSYGPEREYYDTIYRTFHNKITSELEGKNMHNRRESQSSRRFVYTDNSCISFIQAAIRYNVLDFNVVIRSSDVENTFSHDLAFLYYLAGSCFERFSEFCDKVRMRFNLNSAHIIG